MDNHEARNEFIMAHSCVLNANHGLKHGHSTASQDFENENGNVQ